MTLPKSERTPREFYIGDSVRVCLQFGAGQIIGPWKTCVDLTRTVRARAEGEATRQ